jgi:peptidoglycan/xylan/chitin deacetylase (PgdA/CDA1 family)
MVGSRLRNRSRDALFLCYHSVAPAGPRWLTVTRGLFEAQLDELARRGYVTGGLAELEALAAGERPARPTAFLTFDDGFLDNHGTVAPILRERGLRAFVFVLPPLVDDGAPLAWPEVAADQRRHPETMRSVTWEMLGEMREAGFEIGSHGLTHAHLPTLEGAALREELLDSRRRIEARLGSCATLAYPFGEWDRKVADAARDCGYSYAFTLPTKTGQWRVSPWSIPRINIDLRDEGPRLGAKLSPLGRRAYLATTVGRARALAGRLGGRGGAAAQ